VKPAVIVEAIGGLANRLRVVLSYWAAYSHIEVVWRPDGEIANAKFGDVFQALPGRVTFLEDHPSPQYRTTDPVHGVAWAPRYGQLRLRADHYERWRVLRATGTGPYDAMHVRRTDIVDYSKTIPNPTDEQFVAWGLERTRPIFVACDNGTTQRKLIRAIDPTSTSVANAPPRVFFNRVIAVHDLENIGGVRNTTLADAAIDLFMCGGSADFLGTEMSSFTNAVHVLRGMDGWWKGG
jgi:hypothetical protein